MCPFCSLHSLSLGTYSKLNAIRFVRLRRMSYIPTNINKKQKLELYWKSAKSWFAYDDRTMEWTDIQLLLGTTTLFDYKHSLFECSIFTIIVLFSIFLFSNCFARWLKQKWDFDWHICIWHICVLDYKHNMNYMKNDFHFESVRRISACISRPLTIAFIFTIAMVRCRPQIYWTIKWAHSHEHTYVGAHAHTTQSIAKVKMNIFVVVVCSFLVNIYQTDTMNLNEMLWERNLVEKSPCQSVTCGELCELRQRNGMECSRMAIQWHKPQNCYNPPPRTIIIISANVKPSIRTVRKE